MNQKERSRHRGRRRQRLPVGSPARRLQSAPEHSSTWHASSWLAHGRRQKRRSASAASKIITVYGDPAAMLCFPHAWGEQDDSHDSLPLSPKMWSDHIRSRPSAHFNQPTKHGSNPTRPEFPCTFVRRSATTSCTGPRGRRPSHGSTQDGWTVFRGALAGARPQEDRPPPHRRAAFQREGAHILWKCALHFGGRTIEV